MSWMSFPLTSPEAGIAQSPPDAKLIEPGSVSVYMMLDEYYDHETNKIILRRSTEPPPRRIENAPFEQYCFNIIRHITLNPDELSFEPSGKREVQINSNPLKSICRRVMGQGISWSSSPLRVSPMTFLPYYYRLKDHLEILKAEVPEPEGTQHLELLLLFLFHEHFNRLWELADLGSRGEITFELLNCILLPETILITHCVLTGKPLACRLVEITNNNGRAWDITAAYVEATGDRANYPAGPPFGHAKLVRSIKHFEGNVPICSLEMYPMKLHPHEPDLRGQLVARGRMWGALAGVFQKRYDGVAYSGWSSHSSDRVRVSSRIMIDRDRYGERNSQLLPTVVKIHDSSFGSDGDSNGNDGYLLSDPYPLLSALSDDDALMAPALVYGFSLEDKRWLMFDVMHIADIKWREEAFGRLVLPDSHKRLIKRLIEAQISKHTRIEDVIDGKGRGLVVNLFGPAGVGKTLTAEAASEHLHLPLYVVGSGDLGTSPSALNDALTGILKLGSAWGAIVLIDEADVYMEQRSAHDLERNALVSVFLRQLEYFDGLLFLTTNRVRAFDAAFQSRIHISLHYSELDEHARRTLWRGFVVDVGGRLSQSEEATLAAIPLNGRQIKNTVKTAVAVASSGNEQVSYEHIQEAVGIMQQFNSNLQSD